MEMEMTMIERVMKAIDTSCHCEGDRWKAELPVVARAAIEAMREPDGVMRARGQWTISDNLTVSVCVENNRKAAEIWQAMIDAALTPEA
jgi:hypothetical protein